METRELRVEGWRKIVHVRDADAGLNAIISVHDATLGPAVGGCRFFPYADFDAALEDAKRLSRGMTFKNALADIPFGGGKSVIIGDPKTDKSEALFRAFGRAIEALGGLYYTAEDSGVSEHDLAIVREETEYVAGVEARNAGGNPSPFTARGVFRGIEAAVRFRLGKDALDGVSVSILGVGAVGMSLAELLHKAGAALIVADVNARAVEEAVRRFGARACSPQDAVSADVDVFSPCALGGAINRETLPKLKAKIVAGAANNQLATPEMDEELRVRNILYAPDYVVNAAGVMSVGLEIIGAWDPSALNRRIDAIAQTATRIFQRAAQEGRPTGEIADEMALDIIAKAKKAA